MQLKTFAFIILLTSIQVSAQNNNRWRVGAFFSPDVCYRNLINHDGSEIISSIIETRNSSETYKIGYTFGFMADYRVNQLIRISSGIGYTDKGFQNKQIPLRMSINNQPEFDAGFASNIYHYLFLEVPIAVNFNFKLSEKLKLTAGIGAAYNKYLNNFTVNHFEFNDGRTETQIFKENFNFNSSMFSGILKAGIEYNISENLCLKVEPIYRRGISSLFEAPIYCYLNSTGLSIGCMYQLKKNKS